MHFHGGTWGSEQTEEKGRHLPAGMRDEKRSQRAPDEHSELLQMIWGDMIGGGTKHWT